MATIIDMPKLSDTMTTGTVVKWLVEIGAKVEVSDELAEVETDKATMPLESFDDGVVLAFYAKEGEEVAVGDPICAIGDEGEDPPKPEKKSGAAPTEPEKKEEPENEGSTAPVEETKEKPQPASETPSQPKSGVADTPAETTESGGRIKASPLARKMAEEKGIPLASLKGSGPNGRIVKADILAAEKSGVKSAKGAPAAAAAPVSLQGAPVAEEKALPVSKMRATIAKRLVESKTQLPHFYLETEIDAAALIKLRADLNGALAELPPEKGGIKFTVNDFILKASAEALRREPGVNVSWMGDKIQQHGAVHLAFGVAIDEGLLTPVIRDAHLKSVRQISIEARQLAAKARDRKLTPNEMTGSTFTVTNLGMFGTTSFYGIINPPNAAILSVGATVKKPVVDAKDNIVVGHRMSVGLSGDHRVIDGAVGARFLAAFKEIIETPSLMLV